MVRGRRGVTRLPDARLGLLALVAIAAVHADNVTAHDRDRAACSMRRATCLSGLLKGPLGLIVRPVFYPLILTARAVQSFGRDPSHSDEPPASQLLAELLYDLREQLRDSRRDVRRRLRPRACGGPPRRRRPEGSGMVGPYSASSTAHRRDAHYPRGAITHAAARQLNQHEARQVRPSRGQRRRPSEPV